MSADTPESASETALDRAKRPKHRARCTDDECTFTATSRSRAFLAAECGDHEAATGHETELSGDSAEETA
ncbi:hypothetical protein [Halosegnis longus]|uniref:hypothetical protein n=1 Tax=Halosegnis longus TaxID=2216012 RepID=UPI00096A8806|nr:hypothetical protein [Salella cibi]